MAGVDYKGIRQQLRTILSAESETTGTRVFIEEDPQFGLADNGACIAVFSMARTAPAGEQSVSAGKRVRWHWRLGVWVFAFNMGSFEAACETRDTLLSGVELALMRDRTIGGKANSMWLEGGDLFSARDDNSGVFMAVAETVLVIDVSAVNT